MRKFIEWFFSWFEAIPGEDGRGDYEVDDPHDPQTTRRTVADDNFNFDRLKP